MAAATRTVMADDDDVMEDIGFLTLNIPRQINALPRGMVATLTDQLEGWREDPEVGTTTGKQHEFLPFLAEEFRLDGLIAAYPRPIVAFMGGLCMGGGVGLADHACICIVTPRSAIAMPETRIGYSPDVGGTQVLGLDSGQLGDHLVQTASTMGAGDAIHAGFADFCIPEDAFDDVLAALRGLVGLPAGKVAVALKILHGGPATEARLTADAAWTDESYAGTDVPAILERLDPSPSARATEAAAAAHANSPLTTQTALQAVRAARDKAHLPSALARGLRVAAYLMKHPDLPAGIRAQIIDRDRTPRRSPVEPAEVDQQEIATA